MSPQVVLVLALTAAACALLCQVPSSRLMGIWVCSSVQAVGAGFSPELLLPKEWGGCNNCKNLLPKFQCQATKSRSLCKDEFSTHGCAAAGLTPVAAPEPEPGEVYTP